MELVDRYLRSVKRYLPASDRDDIVAELFANFSAEIEDRENELGRSLDDAECEALLNAHGHPAAVAMRFRPAGQSFTFGRQLVGPALFPFYIRVLAANLVIACLVAIVAYNVPSWAGFPNILTQVFLQFAIVTIVFAVMQGYVDGRGRTWNEPDGRDPRLRAAGVEGPLRVSRLESVVTLVWFVGVNVWLVGLVRSANLFAPERGGTLVLMPIWHAIVIPYAAIVALEVVRNVVNFIRPEMVRFRAVMIATANAVSLAAIVILLRGAPLIGESDPSDLGQLAWAHAVDRGLFISAIVAVALVCAMIAWQIRTMLNLRKASVRSGVALGVVALAMLAIGGSPARAETSAPSATVVPSVPHCSERTEPVASRAAAPAWNGWGADASQSRFQPARWPSWVPPAFRNYA